jgi:hypothetical protein
MAATQTLPPATSPSFRPCPNCADTLTRPQCGNCGCESKLVPVALTRTAERLCDRRTRAFSKRHPVILALVPALAAVFLASACSAGSTGSSGQAPQPSQSVVVAQAPVIAPGYDTPEDAVDGLIQAELADNSSQICSYLVPSSQPACDQQAQQQQLPAFTGNITVDNDVISGSEALVSATGSICANGGGCTGNSDPSLGMPGGQETFAQAYDQALNNSGCFSPVPCIEENGMWYVNAAP